MQDEEYGRENATLSQDLVFRVWGLRFRPKGPCTTEPGSLDSGIALQM